MKNILKNITVFFSNTHLQEETAKFYPMTIYPPKDGKEPFSALVLVYDESDSRYFDLGYYDFEEKRWRLLNEESMNLKCWCHVPDPSEYLTDNKYPIHSIP